MTLFARLIAAFVIVILLAPAHVLLAQGGRNNPAQGFSNPLAQQPSFGDSRDRVSVSVNADNNQVAPGSNAVLALVFDHQPGWHIWTNQGNTPAGMAVFDGAIHTEIKITTPPGSPLRAHEAFIQWPQVHAAQADVGEGPKNYAVFSDRAVAYVPLTIAPDAALGTAEGRVVVTFQSCNEQTCLAPVFDHSIPVKFEIIAPADVASRPSTVDPSVFSDFDPSVFGRIAAAGPAASSANSATPETSPSNAATGRSSNGGTFFGVSLPRADGALGVVLLIVLSMLGGFILNLTPCVLPIIPIKILTISQHAGSPGRSMALGLWMAAGVIAFWAAIGAPAALFSAAADPSRIFGIWWLTAGIGVLIAVMGVGIMGLFTIQLPAAAYAMNPKADTGWGSFLFGVMTAVLGLPCFGFVAGALLVGAATMPAALIMTIFTSLGVGMALPYLVLSAKPSLLKHIPRTGPASELVKHVMGLLLLAAGAYFIGSGLIALVSLHPYLARQLHWWIASLFVVAAGLWLIVRTFQITHGPAKRIAFTVIGLCIATLAVLYSMDSTAKAKADWEVRQAALAASSGGYAVGAWNDFSPQAFEKAREDQRTVVLDFTAEWCLTCKALKATVLNREPVKSELAKDDVALFTVDVTSSGAPGWQRLRELGKTGIPLLVIYSPGVDEPWLANAYTSDQVLEALKQSRIRQVSR